MSTEDTERLFFACCKGGSVEDVVGMTKQYPELIRAVDDLGNTALHYAAAAGKNEVITLLINMGITINVMNKRRETPLFKAASRGRAETIPMLLALGADKFLGNCDSKLPLDIATNDECVTLLQEAVDIPVLDDDDEDFSDD